nr:DUF4173 domain-containing protein [Neobacillus sp. Marseille-Q6967]
MDIKLNKKDWIFFVFCLLLGVLAEEAFFRAEIGISYIVFIFGFYLVFFWRFQSFPFSHQRFGYLLLICIWLLAAFYFIQYNVFFYVLNILVIPALVIFHLVVITSPKNLPWFKPIIIPYLFSRLLESIRYNIAFISLFSNFISKSVNGSKYQVWKKVLMGVIISVPVLFVVLQLLMSADSQFERMVAGIPNWFRVVDVESGLRMTIILIYCFAFFALLQILIKKQIKTLQQEVSRTWFRIDGITTLTVLILINTVYVLFTAVQFKYFFSGTLQGDFTFAEYARKGFFELLFVTLINLTMIVLVLNFVDRTIHFIKRFTQLLLTILVLSSAIMLSSAFLRLSMYEEAYGFTFIRVMSHSFMIFLVVIFMYTLTKIWVEKLSLIHFYFICGLIYYTTMNVIDIENIIVTQNVERYEQSGKIDIHYLNRLSYSGIIGLINLYEENKSIPGLKEILQERKREAISDSKHWQSYNLKKEQAYERLRNLQFE